MIRQGDVLLKKCSKMPGGMKKIAPVNGRLVLAEGEATGHAHTIDANLGTLFGIDDQMVVVIDHPAKIEHQEHSTIEIAPGQYWVVRQREYSPEKIRRVMD
jgi:hypothetical protein